MRHIIRLTICSLLILAATQLSTAQKPELVVQTGDAGGPNIAAFSPDGRLIATAGWVRLWETATGRKLRDFKAGADCLAFSPDGRELMASGDFTVRVWDVLTGRELRRFKFMHDGWSFGRAFSPDRSIFASGGDDGTVKLWDMKTGGLLRTMRAPGLKVYAVAFSPDGRTVVGGGNGAGQPLRFWSVATGAPLASSVVPSGMVHTLDYSPDGRFIASDDRNTIKLWDARTKLIVHTLTRDVDSFHIVTFSPDSRTLASQAPTKTDRLVDLWDVATGRLVRELRGNIPFAFSHDGKTMAVGSRDDVKLLNAATDQELAALRAHAPYVDAVAFSPDGRMLAGLTDGRPRTVKLWNVSAGRELTTLKDDTNMAAPSLAFSPDSRRLASPSAFDVMKVWDTLTGQTLLSWGKDYYLGFSRVLYFPDGRYIVTLSGSTVVYWDATTSKPYGTLKGDGGEPLGAAFSPDGRLLAIGGFNKTVTVWDVATAQKRFELRGHTETIYSVAFSPDSRTLASASDDKLVKLWDMATGGELRTLHGHTDRVGAVAYSPDGKTLVSAGFNGELKLWAADTGRELYALRGATGDIIQSVAYSADGKMIAAAGFGDGVHLFDTTTGQELATLIAVDENDYLIVTPDGLFDGTPAAWNLVLWRFGQNSFDVLPAEAFFNEFFYPGLLADLFAGRRPKAARDLAQKDRRQTQVRLALAQDDSVSAPNTVTTRGASLKISISEASADVSHPNGSGAQDVRLFRNGSLVKVWSGDVLKGKGTVTLDSTAPIVAGENKFTAYAFNHDNIKSSDATLVINGAESLKRQGTAYVLAFGVNVYSNQDYNLKYAVADAQDFAAEVKARLETQKRYTQVKVIILSDAEATKTNITQQLLELSTRVQPEDAVIVYFAGHGTAQGNQFYLIPHDLGYEGAREKLDEPGLRTILDHSISDRELERVFEGIDAGQFLLVIDACNSGQALEAEEKRRGPMNSKGLAQLAYEKGMYVLTAAQSYQAAQEAAKFGHGFLTYALVEEGLKQGAADREPKDGTITLRKWLNYATDEVPRMQEQNSLDALHGRGRYVVFAGDGRGLGIPNDAAEVRDNVQRPRVFYRRELESNPLVIAVLGATPLR